MEFWLSEGWWMVVVMGVSWSGFIILILTDSIGNTSGISRELDYRKSEHDKLSNEHDALFGKAKNIDLNVDCIKNALLQEKEAQSLIYNDLIKKQKALEDLMLTSFGNEKEFTEAKAQNKDLRRDLDYSQRIIEAQRAVNANFLEMIELYRIEAGEK